MPPRVTTRSAGRPTVISQGGGIGGRAGRGCGRIGSRSGDQGNGRNDGQGGQVGGQGSEINGEIRGRDGQVGGQGSEVNDGVDRVPDSSTIIVQQLQNLLLTIVKYTAGSFVGKDLTWWNSQIHARGREVAVGMFWEDFKTLIKEEFCSCNEMQKLETELWNHAMIHKMVVATELTMIQSVLLKAGVLTDEAIRNGSIKKNLGKSGNIEEPSRDNNVKDENKRTMI
uniref:Reverse transcriptase domain-containing protein n=1 Tax=Tanacetum cinerariifolium TaxID=118510 RepID=A0A6L2LTE4_TANCI|nr:reverse transcriptase domain-containing protein [Tanacetum cinerariifolium]